ncbi:hypothetical protein PGT21_002324 [Puccinia graminis f. sp. tritici]|uniref:Uncharacterized protein n=1 Tax=Puccinia graminis f. sp. tritici TaxID=56615 RepID=A0A5B0SJ77_PUCGR|nr:hypothetical protein PGT21_002324 [Puccinia graminis f. sp. tritici]KAA1137183.1 hypothetical protein PGTUg99_012339 [Puccinia graminis f. sp. tritici]
MYSASPPILTSQGEGQNDGWVVTDQWPLAMAAAAKTNSAESFAPGVFSLHLDAPSGGQLEGPPRAGNAPPSTHGGLQSSYGCNVQTGSG